MKRAIETRSGLPTVLRTAASRLAAGVFLSAAACAPAAAATFNVDTPTDGFQKPGNTTTCQEVNASNVPTGHCSLRAAIAVGNGITGPHVINIATAAILITNGSGWDMRATYVLNGNGVTIDGNGLACLQLDDSGTDTVSPSVHNGSGATGSSILNINIGHCSGNAISANGHGYTFANNHIGVDATGTAGIFAGHANTGSGIALSASAAYASQFIDVAGLQSLYDALPAQPVDSIEISNFSVNIATALQNLNPNKITGNVISNNAQNGIDIFSQNLAATIISNNFIGTDATGNVAVPNGTHGISLEGSTFGNLIGPNNTISGNTLNGINVAAGAVFLPNFIMGNRIGLATTAGNHIGNGQSGIVVDSKPDTSVGHINPSGTGLIVGPLNVIGDNQGANNDAFPDQLGSNGGIVITGSSTGIKVTGNRIGIGEFPSGTPVANTQYGNKGDGIIVTTSGNKIGGSGAADGNVVAGNARHGIVVSGSDTQSTAILGNSIGVDPAFAGNLALGNVVDGIHIDAANSVTIGGTGTTDFNTVAGNGRNGIKIRNGNALNGWSNASQRNLVFHNATASAGVGIDLDYAENAANPVHDEFIFLSYANFDQAQPVICAGPADTGACAGSAAPTSSGGTTSLQWTIKTHGPANFRMEFFRIDSADDNTATKMTFIGEHTISTALSGLPADSAECSGGRCTSSLAASAGGGYIVMTATDVTPLTNTAGNLGDWKNDLKCFIGDLGVILSSCPVNNTSEFSAVASVPAAAPTVVTNAAINITGVSATLEGTVSANGADAGVSFDYGLTNAYGSSSNATPVSVTAAQSGVAVSANIASLTCGTLYHYRAEAANSQGTTLGGDLTFTTAPCAAAAPTATSVAASAIAATSATLNGLVTANGASTTVQFQYGTTVAYTGSGSPANAAQNPLSSGASNAPVSFVLNGLACNTTYHFRVTANNGVGGTVNGSDLSFKTAVCAAVAPTVTTSAATAIGATSATVNGQVSANGATTSVTFDFGTTTAYGALGSPAAATQSPLTSGASNAPVSVALTGLACNTTYHFRANANNGIGGTINGSDATFTTAACVQAPPNVTTFAASAVTATTATLNGTASANGAATTVTFDFGTTTAYGGGGTAAQSPLATNASNVPVTFDVAGLTCNTTYHFRANAQNSGGTVNGGDQSFKTAACAAAAPTVATAAATAIATTSAQLNGTVSANGAATTVGFDFGTTNAYGSTVAAVQSPLSANVSGGAVSATPAGLTCATLYHFRVDATNAQGGPVNGGDLTFTTAACPGVAPTATTSAATAITATAATFNGTVSANGAATNVFFDYGATTAYGAQISATQSPLPAASPANANVSATPALACNQTFHFRVNADNGTGGTIHGADQSFSTSACPIAAPTATTGAASAITATGATLNGSVSANGTQTTVTFHYGPTTAYGTTTAATQSPLAAGSPANAPVTLPVSGLTCGTLYHFLVDANNGSPGGTVSGLDQTFSTSACAAVAPVAVTGAASAIGANGATLNGTVSANGTATTVTFEYGTSSAYGTTTVATQSPLGAASPANAPVTLAVSGLACATLYHFRVDADNGTAGNGSDATFTTGACPAGAPTPVTGAATAVTTTGATLNGTVTANGAATTVTFEYGPTSAYGQTATAAQSPLAAGSPAGAPVSAVVGGLTCGTLYHFRVDANNGNGGTIPGADATFTTGACVVVTTYSAPTATGTGNATAVLSGGGPTCSLLNPAFVGAPAAPPAGETFPDGLFAFTATGCTGTITLTVTFPTPFTAGEQYYKYGGTAAQNAAHWYTLGAANSLSLIGNVASFTLTDGGYGDDDYTVDGKIVDAGGPAVPAAAPPVAPVPAPMLGLWSLFALAGALALSAGVRGRGRGRARGGISEKDATRR